MTPSTLRFGTQFVRALMMDARSMRLSLGREFLDELATPTKWSLDRESPFEKCRVLDPKPNPKILRRIRTQFDATFPELAGTPIVESWAGMIETTPDVVPVIDEAPDLPGFHIATGFSGHGFGIGPGAGKAIAGIPHRRRRWLEHRGVPPEPVLGRDVDTPADIGLTLVGLLTG